MGDYGISDSVSIGITLAKFALKLYEAGDVNRVQHNLAKQLEHDLNHAKHCLSSTMGYMLEHKCQQQWIEDTIR
ncbi:Fc.00g008820.m01.CDS01 [Cosmosporella sp. VM-42]